MLVFNVHDKLKSSVLEQSEVSRQGYYLFQVLWKAAPRVHCSWESR